MTFNSRHPRGHRRGSDSRVNEDESRAERSREETFQRKLTPTRDIRTSDTSVSPWDSVLVDPTDGAITVTLLSAGNEHGAEVEVINASSNNTLITYQGANGATINGAASITSSTARSSRHFRWDAVRGDWYHSAAAAEDSEGAARSALAAQEIDMLGDSIKFDTITANTTYTIVNPEIGRLVILEVDGIFTITLPASVTVINGDYLPDIGTNWLHLYCVDAATPVYLASWTVTT